MGKNRTRKRQLANAESLSLRRPDIQDNFFQESYNGKSNSMMNKSADGRDATYTNAIWRKEYNKALSMLIKLALVRFHYYCEDESELPEGFMPEELERRLLYGSAVMFEWLGKCWTLNYAYSGVLDPYGYQTEIRAIGTNFDRDVTKSGVIVYDTVDKMRGGVMPTMTQISYVAEKIASIETTRESTRQLLHRPIIITAPEEMLDEVNEQFSGANVAKPYIISTPTFGDTKVQLNTNEIKPQAGLEEYRKEKSSLINEGLSVLGVNFNDDVDKGGSMTMNKSDMYSNSDQTTLTRLSFLESRTNALEAYNKKHGTCIKVVWNKSIDSDNYNLMNSISEQAEAGLIGQGVTTGPITEDNANMKEKEKEVKE